MINKYWPCILLCLCSFSVYASDNENSLIVDDSASHMPSDKEWQCGSQDFHAGGDKLRLKYFNLLEKYNAALERESILLDQLDDQKKANSVWQNTFAMLEEEFGNLKKIIEKPEKRRRR